MPYQSSSAASDVSLARFGLRVTPAMQPAPPGGKKAECGGRQSAGGGADGRVRCRRRARALRDIAAVEAIAGIVDCRAAGKDVGSWVRGCLTSEGSRRRGYRSPPEAV